MHKEEYNTKKYIDIIDTLMDRKFPDGTDLRFSKQCAAVTWLSDCNLERIMTSLDAMRPNHNDEQNHEARMNLSNQIYGLLGLDRATVMRISLKYEIDRLSGREGESFRSLASEHDLNKKVMFRLTDSETRIENVLQNLNGRGCAMFKVALQERNSSEKIPEKPSHVSHHHKPRKSDGHSMI